MKLLANNPVEDLLSSWICL